MSRRAWWLSGAALLLLLPVTALGIAVTVVDPNDYTPQIVAAVQRATGRALTLGGPLRISRSLWPTIAVTDVKLANLPGGSRPNMARAERIEAQLSLPALLHRRIELSKLTLVGPNILLELVGGQPNWVLNGEADAQPSPPGQRVTLDIRAAHVRNGMVTLRLPTRTHVVGIRALELQHPTADGPLGHCQVGEVGGAWQPVRHDDVAEPVSRFPLPGRGHPAHGLALSLSITASA